MKTKSDKVQDGGWRQHSEINSSSSKDKNISFNFAFVKPISVTTINKELSVKSEVSIMSKHNSNSSKDKNISFNFPVVKPISATTINKELSVKSEVSIVSKINNKNPVNYCPVAGENHFEKLKESGFSQRIVVKPIKLPCGCYSKEKCFGYLQI